MEGTTAIITGTEFQPVIDALANQINVTQVMNVLVIVVGACVGLAFAWWGVRKVTYAIMSAFRKGKVSI